LLSSIRFCAAAFRRRFSRAQPYPLGPLGRQDPQQWLRGLAYGYPALFSGSSRSYSFLTTA
jgi:hypothetical protein